MELPSNSRVLKLIIIICLMTVCFCGLAWGFLILKQQYEKTNHNNNNNSKLIKKHKIQLQDFYNLHAYFLPKNNDGDRTIFLTFFKTRSSDGQSHFTSFISNNNHVKLSCYDLVKGKPLKEYCIIIKTQYLDNENNNTYTIKSQINLVELKEDIAYGRENKPLFTIKKNDYSKLLKFLKSVENDIQKKFFFTFFVNNHQIAIYTFDDVYDLFKVLLNKKLQDMEFKEQFNQSHALELLLFYILDNMVFLRNDDLVPVATH